MKETKKMLKKNNQHITDNVAINHSKHTNHGMEVESFGLFRQNEISKQLKLLIEEKRIYLNPNLTLNSLSKMLGTNCTYVSRIINQHYHCNFRTFLKRYRIKYSKKLMKEEYCPIETVAKQCGFLSRSSFYAAFQELVHMPPAEYRDLYRMGKLT